MSNESTNGIITTRCICFKRTLQPRSFPLAAACKIARNSGGPSNVLFVDKWIKIKAPCQGKPARYYKQCKKRIVGAQLSHIG